MQEHESVFYSHYFILKFPDAFFQYTPATGRPQGVSQFAALETGDEFLIKVKKNNSSLFSRS